MTKRAVSAPAPVVDQVQRRPVGREKSGWLLGYFVGSCLPIFF
jgi:hypothetical protein